VAPPLQRAKRVRRPLTTRPQRSECQAAYLPFGICRTPTTGMPYSVPSGFTFESAEMRMLVLSQAEARLY
jgi:hypothetical protein